MLETVFEMEEALVEQTYVYVNPYSGTPFSSMTSESEEGLSGAGAGADRVIAILAVVAAAAAAFVTGKYSNRKKKSKLEEPVFQDGDFI